MGWTIRGHGNFPAFSAAAALLLTLPAAQPAQAQTAPNVATTRIETTLTPADCLARARRAADAWGATSQGGDSASRWMRRGDFTGVILCNLQSQVLVIMSSPGNQSADAERDRAKAAFLAAAEQPSSPPAREMGQAPATPTGRQSETFPAEMAADYFNEVMSIPKGWTLSYKGREGRTHVYIMDRDLDSAPQTSFMQPIDQIQRLMCGEETLAAYFDGSVVVRVDSRDKRNGQTSLVPGPTLSSCGGGW